MTREKGKWCCALDRSAFNQGTNAKFNIGIDDRGGCFTVTAKGPGAVCYAVGNGQTNQVPISDKAGALNCMHDQQACLSVGEKDTEMVLRRFTPTECGRLQGMPDWWVSNLEMSNPKDEDIEFWRKVFSEYAQATGGKVKSEAQIRRFLRNPRSDAAEYKMWGNGIALPCAMYVMEGIADLLRN